MNELLEKYRLYIGIGLILIIIGAISFLLYQTNKKTLSINSYQEEIANLQKENQSLINQIDELKKNQESISSTNLITNSGLININTADQKLLDSLPGIGLTRAQQIIDYRDKNGGFKKIEEIKNISGIGDKIFDQIKNTISVE